MADNSVKVIANMAIPVSRRGRTKVDVSKIYPFADMAVGDCLVVRASVNSSGKANIAKARNAAMSFVKDTGGDSSPYKFVSRDISGQPVIGPDGKPTGEVFAADTFGLWRVPRTVTVEIDDDAGQDGLAE